MRVGLSSAGKIRALCSCLKEARTGVFSPAPQVSRGSAGEADYVRLRRAVGKEAGLPDTSPMSYSPYVRIWEAEGETPLGHSDHPAA